MFVGLHADLRIEMFVVVTWAAIRYSADHIMDYIELDEKYAIFEVMVPENWVGRSIGQIDIRKKYSINILGIKYNDKMNIVIAPDIILTREMSLLVMGEYKTLQKCFDI